MFGALGGRGGKVLGIPLGEAFSVTAGAIGTDVLTGYVAKIIPMPIGGPVGQLLTKALTVAGGSMLVRRFAGPRMGNAFALGGGVSLLMDVFDTYVKPRIPGLAEYETERLSVGTYEPEFSLNGLGAFTGSPGTPAMFTSYLSG